MCTPQCIVEKLADLAFLKAVKEGKYVLHYEKNLGKLKDEIKNLNDRRECIDIEVREAMDGGEEIMPDVKTWLTIVDSMKTDVDQLIQPSTAMGNMHCIACTCPNLKLRYQLSKQAEQKIPDVKELTEKGHFDRISQPKPPPPELEFPSDENYVNLDSRTQIFNNIVDALKDPKLPEPEAWVLFKKKVGNYLESQPELTTIGHKVCNKCKGLPVAINALGEALKGKSNFAWHDALVKLERYELMDIEGFDASVGASLRLSYDLLKSPNAKSCFLLCCLFREDAEIPIGDLTRHCLARRLLSQNPRTVEEVRNSVLTVIDTLKSASLLSNGRHGNVVKIHDIIRDVGISIAHEENAFFVEHGALHWPENPIDGPPYSAISLISAKLEALPTKLTCPKLRTLIYENSKLSDLEVPDEFFSEMTQLSVLILTRMHMRSSLGKLANLRMLYLIECHLPDIAILWNLRKTLEVLNLQGSGIEVLPPEIGQLTSLRVLDLEECDKLNVIPRGVISNLMNLEELYFPETFYEWDATTDKKHDTNTSNNLSLEELRRSLTRGQLTVLHIHIPDVMLLPKEVLKFENLKRFRISVGFKFTKYEDFPGTRVLKHKGISLRNEFIPLVYKAEVLYLSRIKGLKKVLHDRSVRNGFLDLKYLEVTSCDDDFEYLLGEPKSSVQSQGQISLQSFNKLIVLLVDNCKLKYLFSPTTARGLVHLEQLEVRSCEILEGIIGFEGQNDVNDHVVEVKFGKLKKLILKNLPNLVSFHVKKEKTQTTMGSSSSHPQPLFNEEVAFPALEYLTIDYMPNMTEIWDKKPRQESEKETQSFYKLRVITVEGCNQLVYVLPPCMLPQLQNVQELSIYHCGELEVIVSKELKENEAADNDIIVFHQLKKLVFWNLPKLKSLYTGTQVIFSDKVAFPSLKDLTICGLPKIKEIWDNQPLPKPGKDAESFYKLSYFRVEKCLQLVYVFPSYMLPQLQHLEELMIRDCEDLKEVVSKELKDKKVIHNDIVFPQLKATYLWNLPNLERFFTETQLFFSDKVAFPVLLDIDLDEDLKFLWNGTSTKEVSMEDAFPVLKETELTDELEFLLNGTSTNEECGTSGKENDHNDGEED
ncbi:hypothetical protein Vadar_005821 [Vaccinium darrowii]|uniref:Uncharacterized protein n=1 Tax=Vaccinium darrowii TaxID=229202 RepID=A0ACB7YKN5_9ERIC|nr:hypothetical protein Vadar_005821 [Vaccinium darrowii]